MEQILDDYRANLTPQHRQRVPVSPSRLRNALYGQLTRAQRLLPTSTPYRLGKLVKRCSQQMFTQNTLLLL